MEYAMISGFLVLASGLFNVTFSLIMQTENIRSSLLFKVFPFLFGMTNIFIACKLLHWL